MMNILSHSLGLTQIIHRVKSFYEIIFGYDFSILKIGNFLVLLMIEIFLGSWLSSYLITFPNLYQTIEENFNGFLTFVMDILKWLRGTPAGFKLNEALNSLLARFFSYHLHLWRNYIGFLSPILSFLLSSIVHTGCLGISIQLALTKDLLSLATFHVYCLYIYAARLFNIHTKGIVSLCRLCLGRKWNPLRKRVDSIQLNNSEMFVSSLLFTIALLITPTVIIYYIVFLLLCVPVLMLETVLTDLKDFFNSFEIVTSFLILMNSSLVADEIYIEPYSSNDDADDNTSNLFIEIRLQTIKSPFNLPQKGEKIKATLKNILQGNVL